MITRRHSSARVLFAGHGFVKGDAECLRDKPASAVSVSKQTNKPVPALILTTDVRKTLAMRQPKKHLNPCPPQGTSGAHPAPQHPQRLYNNKKHLFSHTTGRDSPQVRVFGAVLTKEICNSTNVSGALHLGEGQGLLCAGWAFFSGGKPTR